MCKRVLSFFIAAVCLLTVPFCAQAAEKTTLDSAQSVAGSVISYKKQQLGADSIKELLRTLSADAGTFTADWYYIALNRYGYDCSDEKSVESLINAAEGFYEKGLEKTLATDMQRVSLALTACGVDITDVNGHNLLADATYNRADFRPLNAQGVNSLSYALILLDSKRYSVPENARDNRGTIIRSILKYEAKNGGFDLTGSGYADTDITAITLQALAPYKNRKDIAVVIDKALNVLSSRQNEVGGYKNFYGDITSETTAQVILALISLGINPLTDSRFIKNGYTTVDALASMQLESGAFAHTTNGSENEIATYQSLTAFVSLCRFLSGEDSYYDFGTHKSGDDNGRISSSKIHSSSKNKNSKTEINNSSKETKVKLNSKIDKKTSINSQTDSETKKAKNKKTSKKTSKSSVIKSEKETIPQVTESTAAEDIKQEKKQQIVKKETDSEKTDSVDYISPSVLLLGYVILFFVKMKGEKK